MIFAALGVIPLVHRAFPVPDRDRHGRAVEDLHETAGLADEVGALLDRGAVGRGARADVGSSSGASSASGDSADGAKMPAGSRFRAVVSSLRQGRVVGPGPAGVGRPGP